MCIHELSECAYHPSAATFAARADTLRALMERPEAITSSRPQVAARIVAVPSTDDFTSLAVGYQSQELAYTKQVPTVAYPHWAVTTDAPSDYGQMVRHYERTIYGEINFVGMVKRTW